MFKICFPITATDSTATAMILRSPAKVQGNLDPPITKVMKVNEMIAPSLYRLTEGLPRKELETMLSEAKDCEAALEKEIKQLEEALQNKETENETAATMMMTSEITPPDRYYAVSALMGRLRDPLSTPLTPLSTTRQHQEQQERLAQQFLTKKKKPPSPDSGDDTPRQIERQRLLLSLDKHPEYRNPHTDSTRLLATWKRISSHRTATVFRRPVNPKEAPGYQQRILFPIDLSLIRKMIAAGMIKTYADLHQNIGLICHNCVKFNGYLSDYAVVARDFEAHIDDIFVQTVTAVPPPNNPTLMVMAPALTTNSTSSIVLSTQVDLPPAKSLPLLLTSTSVTILPPP